jgi:hypothetical protein
MKPILGRRFVRGIPILKVERRTSDLAYSYHTDIPEHISSIIITDILTFAAASGRD